MAKPKKKFQPSTDHYDEPGLTFDGNNPRTELEQDLDYFFLRYKKLLTEWAKVLDGGDQEILTIWTWARMKNRPGISKERGRYSVGVWEILRAYPHVQKSTAKIPSVGAMPNPLEISRMDFKVLLRRTIKSICQSISTRLDENSIKRPWKAKHGPAPNDAKEVEHILRWLKKQSETKPAQSHRDNASLSREAMAVAAITSNSQLTNREIAELVGVHVKSLSRMRLFKRAARINRDRTQKKAIGAKGADGDMGQIGR